MGQKLKLDFSGVETFQRASEGIHTVKIATAEVTQSQGGNDMITVAFEVTKGVDKGARVYENFPLVDKALWKLKGLLEAIGMKADGKVQLDVDKLVGKVCQINVKHEEYDGKTRARCESIMKFSADADVEDDEDEDFDDMNEPEAEEEPEEKPAKKAPKKPAKKEEPEEESEDDEDWDEDEAEEEEPEEKPAKKGKAAKKEEKKPAKKSKKEEEPEDDDDWDDDEDWDEE